jgi:hypothetical protein
VGHLLLGGLAVPCAAGLVALTPAAHARSFPRPLVVVALPAAALDPPLVALDLPSPVRYGPAISHLLAAGGASLLLFAVGFRLLQWFLVAHPPRALVGVVHSAGALGPALIATSLRAGARVRLGAVVEAVAVLGFAVAPVVTVLRSDRRRVGFAGVLAGAALGVVGAGLGPAFANADATTGLVRVHLRVNLLGLLGFAIVGAPYQFYPLAVSTRRWVGDRPGILAITLAAVGLSSRWSAPWTGRRPP